MLHYATIIWTVSNIILSVMLVLINKHIVSTYNFKFMTLLSGLHFITSFLACLVFIVIGFMHYKSVNNFFSIFRIALGSLLSIVFMNYSLAYSSIGFYQMSKLLCIPMTLLIETMFSLRQQTLTWTLLCSLALIVLGMLMVTEQEVRVSPKGVMWALMAVVATSAAQIFFGPLKKGLGLDALQLLFHTAPWLSFGSFISIPLLENTEALLRFDFSGQALLLSIAASCLVAVAFNAVNYVLLGLVSPMTYTVLGHAKTIVIVLAGSYYFDGGPPSSAVLRGVALAMGGVAVYSAEVNRQEKATIGAPSHNMKELPFTAYVDAAVANKHHRSTDSALDRTLRTIRLGVIGGDAHDDDDDEVDV